MKLGGNRVRGRVLGIVAVLLLNGPWGAAQEGMKLPPFAPDDAGGMPGNLIVLRPLAVHDHEVLPAGPCYIWQAREMKDTNPRLWGWRRFGPYTLKGGRRYIAVNNNGAMAINEENPSKYQALSEGESSVKIENNDVQYWYGFVFDPRPAGAGEGPGELPPFAPSDAGGMPSNLVVLEPRGVHAHEVLRPGTCFIWQAPVVKSVDPRFWIWRRYGPYGLKGGKRYVVVSRANAQAIREDVSAKYTKLAESESSVMIESQNDVWHGYVFDAKGGATPLSYSSFQGHRYALTETAGNWEAANREAAERGGHLVVIETAEENQWLLEKFGDGTYWIGLRQAEGSQEPAGDWQWVDGTPLDYANWDGGQPDNFTGRDNYSCFLQGSGGRWHDVPVEGWPQESRYKGIIELD